MFNDLIPFLPKWAHLDWGRMTPQAILDWAFPEVKPDFAALAWEKRAGANGGPDYEEAELTPLFEDLVGHEGEWLRVSVRRYPKRYFVAYEYDPPGADNFEYTLDGEGCGLVPGFSVAYVVLKVLHADFEANFVLWMAKLRSYLREAVVA